MNQLKVFLIAICLFGFFPNATIAQPEPDSIEGTYRLLGTDTGLQIMKLLDGNYLFKKVFLEENVGQSTFEWQSDYVCANKDSAYIFSWHTGRYQDIPGTNKLIVYNVIYSQGKLIGTYFFPETPQSPPGDVTYVKHKPPTAP